MAMSEKKAISFNNCLNFYEANIFNLVIAKIRN